MRFRPLAADLEPLLTRAGLGVVATRGGVRGRRAASALLVLAPRRPDMSAERAELDAAVDAGLGDVAARLGRGGQWPSRRHERADRTDAGRHEISPCVTALGVLALAGVAHPLVDTIRRRSRAHLAGTMQPPGLWRYYGDFPCDVDTSALAALALGHPFLAEGRYAPALVGARLGDGRFRIWMVPGDPVAGEPDVVANANAVAALGQRPEIDPAVRWITDVVDQGRAAEAAWYYRDELDLALAIQRAVDGGVVALRRSAQASARRAAVRLGRDAATLSPHRLAQAIVAAAWDGFASTDEALARAQALLAAQQRPDGSWPADLFSVGPRPPDPPRFWFVSEAVTTALCVGALTVGAVESRNALR